MNTVSAPTKFYPVPPALREIKKIGTSLLLNSLHILNLSNASVSPYFIILNSAFVN